MLLLRPALAVLLALLITAWTGRAPLDARLGATQPAAAPIAWQPQASGVTVRLRGVSAVSATSPGPAAPTARCCAPPTAAAPGSAGLCRAPRSSTSATSTPSTVDRGRAQHRPGRGIAHLPDQRRRGTWTERFRNTDPEAFFDAMAFADPTPRRRGQRFGGRTLRHPLTADGGRTWTPVPADRPAAGPARRGRLRRQRHQRDMAGRDHIWIGTTAAGCCGRATAADLGRCTRRRSPPASHRHLLDRVSRRPGRRGRRRQLPARRRGGGQRRHHHRRRRDVDAVGDAGCRASAPRWRGCRAGRPLLAVGPGGADWSADQGRTWRPAGGEGYDAVSVAPAATPAGPPALVDGLRG